MMYGLIGERLGHSYSKIIHGLMGNEQYELCEIPRNKLDAFLQKADFCGINVTIPYKETVMPYCILSEEAKRIGSVNTIVSRNGSLYGYNTDYMGFLGMLRRAKISLEHKKVLILGSGGTSKTACCVAADQNAREIVVISHKENNSQNLARHFDAEILINTTPVGMYPANDGWPVELDGFSRLEGVADVIYNPLYTNLLLAAQKRGIPVANGLSMLAIQACYANDLFFDCDTTARLEEIIRKCERIFNNIILIGMPGCGKSTLGRRLAEQTGRSFVDTDEEITNSTRRTPAEIISTDGEAFFREVESAVLREATKKTGQVIATGGGSVLLEKNRDYMRQNGYILFLERDISELETKNRPLSLDLRTLYQKRYPIYQSLCHHRVQVQATPDQTLQRIGELL